MRFFFLIAWSFPCLVFAGGISEGPGGVTVPELIRIGHTQKDLAHSLEAVSAALKGTPYLLGNAGEGAEDVFDQDPQWRLDVQDCTTFLETVMAVSISHDLRSFEKTLFHIRYDGGWISFNTRNHFPEADWIPNNSKEGFVRDITTELFPGIHRSVRVRHDKNLWYAKKTAESIEPKERDLAERERLAGVLRSYSGTFPQEEISVSYLPMQAMYKDFSQGGREPNTELLQKIPSGTVFNIVRETWAPNGVPMAISHQGFIFQRADGTTIMRHSSPNRGVVEDRIDEYFLRFLESPTIRGVNLLEIRDPSRARSRQR